MQLPNGPIYMGSVWILRAKEGANGSFTLPTKDIKWGLKTIKRAIAFATLPTAIKRKPDSTIHSQIRNKRTSKDRALIKTTLQVML